MSRTGVRRANWKNIGTEADSYAKVTSAVAPPASYGCSFHQQPGGDTPGVAAAPVALAGGIVRGIARFIVMLSAHADVLGVGMTAAVGSIVVPPSCVTSC
jgi:hypothetical protein